MVLLGLDDLVAPVDVGGRGRGAGRVRRGRLHVLCVAAAPARALAASPPASRRAPRAPRATRLPAGRIRRRRSLPLRASLASSIIHRVILLL